MITSARRAAPLLHPHRRVTPRHAQDHDFAEALRFPEVVEIKTPSKIVRSLVRHQHAAEGLTGRVHGGLTVSPASSLASSTKSVTAPIMRSVICNISCHARTSAFGSIIPVTDFLICVHRARSRRLVRPVISADLAQGDVRGVDADRPLDAGDAEQDSVPGRLVNSCLVHGVWRSAAEVVRLTSDMRPGPRSGERIIATAARVILRFASRRIAIFLARRRWNCCSGDDRQVVKKSASAVGPNAQFGSRRCTSSTASSPRHRLRTGVSSPPAMSRFVRLHAAISWILNSPSNDTEYRLPTATMAN